LVIGPAEIALIEGYFELLDRWNAKINLTALPLTPPTEETVERLFLEPLLAQKHIPIRTLSWIDIGSGSGSPAIPLKIVRPALELTMVESRSRKAAFLRECIATLGLRGAGVENCRFQELPATDRRAFDLVTVRGVRLDEALARAVLDRIAPNGQLLVFRSSAALDPLVVAGFARTASVPLVSAAVLDVLSPDAGL